MCTLCKYSCSALACRVPTICDKPSFIQYCKDLSTLAGLLPSHQQLPFCVCSSRSSPEARQALLRQEHQVPPKTLRSKVGSAAVPLIACLWSSLIWSYSMQVPSRQALRRQFVRVAAWKALQDLRICAPEFVPCTAGSTLYTIFEVQAWLSLAVSPLVPSLHPVCFYTSAHIESGPANLVKLRAIPAASLKCWSVGHRLVASCPTTSSGQQTSPALRGYWGEPSLLRPYSLKTC